MALMDFQRVFNYFPRSPSVHAGYLKPIAANRSLATVRKGLLSRLGPYREPKSLRAI